MNDEQSALAAFALDPTLNDKEVNTFKPGYVLISLLITAVGCYSVQLKEFIGIRLLGRRSQQQIDAMTASQLTSLSRQCDK